MYPLISEYIEAIKSAEDNFDELSYLRPVLKDDGLPVMTSGNFAVIFKMKDERSGKFYAIKCFTREQEGRNESYREIAKELKKVSSPYILSIRYLDKELFVDTDQTTETEFPVLLMDWVEGKTLDKYLRENLDDRYALEMLAYRFSLLAQWLIPQPFAHGDLKPDNIIVRDDGSLVLVDYDGMYVPAMKGQKARELGSPDFRHPLRTEDDFNEHIDDFPIVSILLSLKAIALQPLLLEEFGDLGRLLFSKNDYLNRECQLHTTRWPWYDHELNKLSELLHSYEWGDTTNNKLEILNRPNISVNKMTSITFEDWDKHIYGKATSLYSKDKKKLLRFYDVLVCQHEGDVYVDDIRDYDIEEGTTTICDECFIGCNRLSHLKIPESVKYIGERAFEKCNFRYIELPERLEYISENAFNNCVFLKAIVITPNSYTKIKDLLPHNVHQLVTINKNNITSKISSFLLKEQEKGKSYWETLQSLINSICSIYNFGGKITPNFHSYSFNKESVSFSICIRDIGDYDYDISNINDVYLITEAIYYSFLAISGGDIINLSNNLADNIYFY